MPHDFIFNRAWYEKFDPEHRLGEFQAELSALGVDERLELLGLLSSCDPREFAKLPRRAATRSTARILRFYVPVPKEEQAAIWAHQKGLARAKAYADLGIAEDERVEDAGLEYDEAPAVDAGRTRVVA